MRGWHRPARPADEALRSAGIEVVMLTGNNERTARAIARQIGIDRVLSKVVLDDKAQGAEVQKLQVKGNSGDMVGDGVNDATALAQADVGFAIGTGTDVAIGAGDVTLIKGSPMCIITAIEISRATMRDNAQCAPELGRRVWLQRAWHSGGDRRLVSVYRYLAVAAHRCGLAFSSVTVVTNANGLRFFQPKRM
jgi:P-type Cu+ transporter